MLNIKQEDSPYFSSRGNWKVTGIVIHTTVGNYEGTLNWFKNNPNKVSAHYVIREDGGEITQMVSEDKAAHHAGIVKDPTTPVYRGDNPNFYTIGIENADGGNPHSHNRESQYKTLAELVRTICKRHNINIDRQHICGHREIRSSKTCPGNIDVDRVVALANEQEEESNMPEYFGKLLNEYQLDLNNEGQIREWFGKAKEFDGKVQGLTSQVENLSETVSDLSLQVGQLTPKVTQLEQDKIQLEGEIAKARSGESQKAWELDKAKASVSSLEGEVQSLQEEIAKHKEKNNLYAYSKWQRFVSLFKS